MTCAIFDNIGHHGRDQKCAKCDESDVVVVSRPHLQFKGIQIKSEEAFHRFCKAIQEIEELSGIHCVKIDLSDVFFCSWIDRRKCRSTPMERLIIDALREQS